MRDLRQSVNFCCDKITDSKDKLLEFNDVIAAVKKLENENTVLKKQISTLTSRFDSVERFHRQNNVEIQNVSNKTGENLRKAVSKIGISLQFPVDSLSIDYITRVPTQDKNKHKNTCK